MKEEKKGFLDVFVQMYFKSNLFLNKVEDIHDSSMQKEFYKIFQPYGLLYGTPVVKDLNLSFDEIISFEERKKIKFVFLSAMLSFFQKSNEEDIWESINRIAEFYATVYNIDTSRFLILKERNIRNKINLRIFEKRILKSKSLLKYFSLRSSHNCLLFLDIIFFLKWLSLERNNYDAFKEVMSNSYMTVLKVIASAMWANGSMEKSERYIFNAFVNSAQFTKYERKSAKLLVKHKVELDDIDFSFANNWLLKKYLLELSIFTIYSDRMIEHPEKNFLLDFSKKLELTDEDFQASLISVESFILKNWDKIKVLRYKSHASMIYGDLKNQILGIGKKYKNSFITEIRESKELMKLIRKSRSEDLSPEEKEKVKEQLIDIVKTIPALSVTLLPGGTLILFALYEILPDEFLPSGFKSKNKNDLPKK